MFFYSSALVGAALLLQQVQGHQSHPIAIPDISKDSSPVSRDLQSFSLEFAYFPDFAGNKSHPNEFTKALLDNFEKITGVLPKVRVGGTTQDHSTYVSDQKESIHLIYKDPSDDQPERVTYGPGFFESYHTLGNIQYIHGLNLNESDPTHLGAATTQACKSIGSKLHLLELGNEFNLSPIMYRSPNYTIEDYVREWNAKSAYVRVTVQKACGGSFPGFMAPSFLLLDGVDMTPLLDQFPGDVTQGPMLHFVDPATTAEKLFNEDSYDKKSLIKELGFHHYMGLNMEAIPDTPSDLQKILMNHTNVVEALKTHVERAQNLSYLGHPYVISETNSIGFQGRNGQSDVFGSALWVVDFSLWAAQNNIERLHFHQGLDYRYGAWQPVQGKKQAPTTRAPYYGHIMVASTIGSSDDARVANIPLQSDTESAYAVYNGNKLSKLVVLNLKAFNHTESPRPSKTYTFQVPNEFTGAKIERLTAPGSDSLDGITFGGVSYDYDLQQGKPVIIDPQHEQAVFQDGVVSITVPDSSAVLLTLK
ncbi:hypothetical protein N7517_008359 [Penicillium concentricum]|uniref:Beta-glucuronidase C-terminal domain-containing protein n=1 Tax=Penicillium concentricum TaxID=293559 RepID=A0A9W9RX46_9EURO|nr:uncharacterized protein N7517_008359 [Penicillium concentricum]KAJ5365473.1 hypothetical protein N7517_008359 [Penicillium concentricum]